MTDYATAITLLEGRRDQLTNGFECIDEQATRITELTESLEKAHERLADSKAELLEIKAALELLKAGSR